MTDNSRDRNLRGKVLAAATLLGLAGKEFGEDKVRRDAEAVCRLAALMDEWSLLDGSRIKMEPGLESLWLATRALALASGAQVPAMKIAESAIRLRAHAHFCKKPWLLPAAVDEKRLDGELIEEAMKLAAHQRSAPVEKPEPGDNTAVVAIMKDDGRGRFALLDQALEESGFREVLDGKFQASGKAREDFRVCIKTNVSMLLRRSDDGIYTDPLLVRHLILRLAERGFTNISVIDAQNLYGGYYLNRGVGMMAAWAGYQGFWEDRPAETAEVYLADGRTAGFEIRDMTDEPVEVDLGGRLGKHPMGKTWIEADFRISFAKAKTHLHDFYTLGVKNVYGALPLQDKPVEYHGKVLSERLTAAMTREFPVHFSIIDAYLTADSWYGAAWQAKANETLTIAASPSIIAADVACSMMMRYDPFISAFFARAAMVLGVEPFRIRGEFHHFPGWRKVPEIQPLVSHNMESRVLRSPSEISGAVFTQGTDKVFPIKHPKVVWALRLLLPWSYLVRAGFDKGLVSFYLYRARCRVSAFLGRGRLPLFGRYPKARDAILEMDRSERARLLEILRGPDGAGPAPTDLTRAQGSEIFRRGRAHRFETMRSPAAFAAVELLRGVDSGQWSEDELARELEYWKSR